MHAIRWIALISLTALTGFSQVVWVQQPTAATGESGGEALFSFVARVTGAGQDLSVSAQKVGGGSASSRFTIVGVGIESVVGTGGSYTQGSYTLSIANLTNADVGSYTFQIIANGIARTPSSQSAALTVVALLPPTIDTQPRSQTATVGIGVSLTVTASGRSLAYQWRKNGSALPGRTSSTLILSPVTLLDSGTYSVFVSNSAGSVTSLGAVLTVNDVQPSITSHPRAVAVSIGRPINLSVSATGTNLTYQWRKNALNLNGQVAPTLAILSAGLNDAGTYTVVVSNSAGSLISNGAVVTVDEPAIPPTIVQGPISQTVSAGSAVTFSVVATGSPSLRYQWRRGSSDILGAITATFNRPLVSTIDAGVYSVVVSNAAGSVQSAGATLDVLPAAQLSNVSVRTALLPGQTVIVGFTVNGSGKEVLIRAVGPSLGAFGVAGAMNDPSLEIYRNSSLIGANDDWNAGLGPVFGRVGAFGLLVGSKDSAALTVVEGSRTVHVKGTSGGVVLVEGYDAGTGTASRIVNLSARNRTGPGSETLIAGFAITGTGNKRILIRGIGPGLAAFGVPGSVADPRLQVFSSAGALIAENDNWNSDLAAVFTSVGAFSLPTGSLDASLVLTLDAGQGYTALVSGRNEGAGEALIEIYEVP